MVLRVTGDYGQPFFNVIVASLSLCSYNLFMLFVQQYVLEHFAFSFLCTLINISFVPTISCDYLIK